MNFKNQQFVYENIFSYLIYKKINFDAIINLDFFEDYFTVTTQKIKYIVPNYESDYEMISIYDYKFLNWYNKKIRREKLKNIENLKNL